MSWFAKQIETEPEIQQTPLEQLEELRQAGREAKAEYNHDWKVLNAYLATHPPLRKPFLLNDKYFSPVNFLKDTPAAQRALENRVAVSKARWNALQAQEADLLLRLGMIK
jgi:hypothetical protein